MIPSLPAKWFDQWTSLTRSTDRAIGADDYAALFPLSKDVGATLCHGIRYTLGANEAIDAAHSADKVAGNVGICVFKSR